LSIKKAFYKCIVPVLIAATIFLFTNPFRFYIFGQDSITFIGLFSFYQNPLFTFNNGIETVYFSFLVNSLNAVFHNPILTEDILMFFGALLATIGIFDLIDVLDFKFGRNASIFGKIVASLFYLYNPFTLSVTWAHIEGWPFLMVAAPFIISFLLDTLYNRGSAKRLLATTILFFFLAMGASGSFLPFILIIILIFLVYWFYFFIEALISHKTIKPYIKKLVYIILFPLLAFLWDFIPMLNLGIAYLNRISGPSLFQLFYSESSTTTLPHVLSLLAYSWIYFVPNAYPWIGSLQVIQLAGYSLLFFVPFSMIMFAKAKNVSPMIVIAILAVVFSTGYNPPFGIINYYLFRLGGPFLIIANAYYFVSQFYVLFLSVLIYFVFGLSLSSIPKSKSNGNLRKKVYTWIRHLSIYYKPLMAIFLIIVIIGISSYPFFTNQVYQRRGTNIDEVNLNNGALELQAFLKSSYGSPDFNSLLIPTSSLDGATYLSYNNNSTFADSKGLISTLDPYPLIWQNNSLISKILENYLSSGNFSNMAGIMRYFHIKYIIFTWDYPAGIYWMTHSPDGKIYNMTEIHTSLVKSFGNPYNFGNYSVFTVPNVTPLLGAIQNPIFVNTSIDNYTNFLASLNYSKIPQNRLKLLTEALPANESGGSSLSILKYVLKKNYELPLDGSLLLMDNGSLLNADIIANSNNSKYLTLKPMIASEISNDTTYSTNMLFENSTYYSKSPSTITFKQNVSLPSLFNIKFSMEDTPFNNRDSVYLKFGDIIVGVQVINVSSTAGSNNYDLGLTADFAGRNNPYGWNNIMLPNIKSTGTKINLSIETYSNYSSRVEVNIPQLNFRTSTMFYFGQDNFLYDAGNAASQYVYGYRMPYNYSLIFATGNDITNVYNFSVLEGYPINSVILEKIKSEPVLIQTEPKISMYGNYYFTLNNVKSDTYVYFINPAVEKNIVETTNADEKATYIKSENPFEIYKITGQSNTTVPISIIFPGSVYVAFPISVVEIVVLSSLLTYLLIAPGTSLVYRKTKK